MIMTMSIYSFSFMNVSSHFVPRGRTQAVDSSPSHADLVQADLQRDQRLCHLHVLQAQPVQQRYPFLNTEFKQNRAGSFAFKMVSSDSMDHKEFHTNIYQMIFVDQNKLIYDVTL